MKKYLIFCMAIVVLHSCQKVNIALMDAIPDSELKVSTEKIVATKTAMDNNNNILWSEGDQIIAFMKTTLGVKYQVKEQYVGTTTGSFSKVSDSEAGDDLESGQEMDHNVVMYPYSTDIWCMKNDSYSPTKSYKINLVIPDVQQYAENSFAEGSFPMVAVSSNNQLTFRNVCGGVKLQFKGVDKIQSIKLEGLNGETISGKSKVICYADGSTPTITMDESSAICSITLDCGDGVQLDEEIPTTFILSVPPICFESGMKITVTDTDGMTRVLTNTSPNTITRSSLLTFSAITYTQTGVFELPEGTQTTYELLADGGTVEIPFTTNVDYEVKIPDAAGDWISIVETKVLRDESITLNILENNTASARSAEILIASTEGVTLQSIIINQEAGNVVLPTNPDELALIDLGLSVKWANYNMGATSPYDVGTATEWGHEEGRDASSPTDMNISGTDYDLVQSELGGDWRLPTAFDFIELEQKCTWTPTVINDVSGNLVTGPNGNSIFLPDVQYWTGTARERSTDNYDYIYGIEWTPESDVIASGKFNRPVQGDVRVIPSSQYSTSEVGKNGFTLIADLGTTAFNDIDLGIRLKISRDGNFYVDIATSQDETLYFDVDNLSSGTTYYVRMSYNILGYTCFDENYLSVTTLSATDGDGIEAEPIDLGLSVKWASWNLGASCMSDKGLELAWGAISTDDETYTAYNEDISGTSHDPATVLWGQEWRLPTVAEWNELGSNYLDYSINAVEGVLLRETLFLPYGGSGITTYMSGTYQKFCYFLPYAYYYSCGTISSSKSLVRPVYDPLPQLDDVSVDDMTSTSVILSSSVVRIGAADITDCGFVYSTESLPTIEQSFIIKSECSSASAYEVDVSGLASNTTYYVRSYAMNSYGTSYGKETSFTTSGE